MFLITTLSEDINISVVFFFYHREIFEFYVRFFFFPYFLCWKMRFWNTYSRSLCSSEVYWKSISTNPTVLNFFFAVLYHFSHSVTSNTYYDFDPFSSLYFSRIRVQRERTGVCALNLNLRRICLLWPFNCWLVKWLWFDSFW